MARGLSTKERRFVKEKMKGKTGVASALIAYDTTDYDTAAAIASENLSKPKIQEALDEAGFNEIRAKNVVAEIMNDQEEESHNRIKAAQEVFKVKGTYAPEKREALNLNLNGKITPKSDLEAIRVEFEEKLKNSLLT